MEHTKLCEPTIFWDIFLAQFSSLAPPARFDAVWRQELGLAMSTCMTVEGTQTCQLTWFVWGTWFYKQSHKFPEKQPESHREKKIIMTKASSPCGKCCHFHSSTQVPRGKADQNWGAATTSCHVTQHFLSRNCTLVHTHRVPAKQLMSRNYWQSFRAIYNIPAALRKNRNACQFSFVIK